MDYKSSKIPCSTCQGFLFIKRTLKSNHFPRTCHWTTNNKYGYTKIVIYCFIMFEIKEGEKAHPVSCTRLNQCQNFYSFKSYVTGLASVVNSAGFVLRFAPKGFET